MWSTSNIDIFLSKIDLRKGKKSLVDHASLLVAARVCTEPRLRFSWKFNKLTLVLISPIKHKGTRLTQRGNFLHASKLLLTIIVVGYLLWCLLFVYYQAGDQALSTLKQSRDKHRTACGARTSSIDIFLSKIDLRKGKKALLIMQVYS